MSKEETVVVCIDCKGWGYERSLSGATVLLKNCPCETCKGTGRMIKTVTTEVVPLDVEKEFGKICW
jgi:DnaJ-class molecular chaperone